MLQFLLSLKREEEIDVVQLGDMYDLWQAKGNIELIEKAYDKVVKTLRELSPTYIVGNHDIDLAPPATWDEDKGRDFGRVWRHLVAGPDHRLRILFEHGHLTDTFNRGPGWKEYSVGQTGEVITKGVHYLETKIHPDIDKLGMKTYEYLKGVIKKANVVTAVRDPKGFNPDKFLTFYINLMDDFNQDPFEGGKADFCLAVVGHTHDARLVAKPKNGRTYYLMDCGAWVNGKHEIGVISGKEMAVCQWE
jgi:UDP-2,3-diacylglucosamine pyrophosphatase LpxH